MKNYINSVLQYFHCVDVGSVPDVSEVHAAFIFRVEFIGRVSCCVYIRLSIHIIYTFSFSKNHGWKCGGWGAGALSGPTGTVD
jgi:hypothetical protein